MSQKDTLIPIQKSLQHLQEWIEAKHYKGYEPFDGLSSWFRPLTFGTLLGDRLLMQLVRQSPVNLRPILGVRPQESTKGRGYMAWGYLTMYQATREQSYLHKAQDCLDWLIGNSSPKFDDYSWGNHFAFAARKGRYSAQESIIVWTSLIGQAFLDAHEITGDSRYLEVAVSACNWITKLPRNKFNKGLCLGYHAKALSSINNSNMLGAALLARTAKVANRPDLMELADEAMLFSCTNQLSDGSWLYGEDPAFHWIDNFHTGYNLDSLKCYLENYGNGQWAKNLEEGLAYFKRTFFETDGRPKYYHNRAYPIDIQCASQAITTLSLFGEEDPESLDLAVKVANWTINNMQRKDGAFIYRIYPWGRAKTPMLHWGQATMYKGLSLLYSRLC